MDQRLPIKTRHESLVLEILLSTRVRRRIEESNDQGGILHPILSIQNPVTWKKPEWPETTHSRPIDSHETSMGGGPTYAVRGSSSISSLFVKRQEMEVGRPQVSYPLPDLAPRGPASRPRASSAAEEADTYGGSKEDTSTRE